MARKRVYKKYDIKDKTKLEGLRFSNLTVCRCLSDPNEISGYTNLLWLCKCDCGKERVVRGYNLINGYTKSCGCKATPERLDLSGKTIGTLTVKEFIPNKGWLCKCSCGNEVIRSSYYLNTRPNLTCGSIQNHPRPKNRHLRLDFTGSTYGEWTVLYRDTQYKGSKVKYIVENKNGDRKSVFSTYIQQYLKHEEYKKEIDTRSLCGETFGDLKVVSLFTFKEGETRVRLERIYDGKYKDTIYVNKTKSKQWLCECRCGNKIIVKTSSLLNGSTTDCGCSSYKEKKLKNKR